MNITDGHHILALQGTVMLAAASVCTDQCNIQFILYSFRSTNASGKDQHTRTTGGSRFYKGSSFHNSGFSFPAS
jgi:hypothetical protein